MERSSKTIKSWGFMRKNICYDNVEFTGMRNYYDESGRGRNSEAVPVRNRGSKGRQEDGGILYREQETSLWNNGRRKDGICDTGRDRREWNG